MTVRDEEFISQCRRVYEVIADCFFLHEPCLSGESGIRKKVSEMVDRGLLTLVMVCTIIFTSNLLFLAELQVLK